MAAWKWASPGLDLAKMCFLLGMDMFHCDVNFQVTAEDLHSNPANWGLWAPVESESLLIFSGWSSNAAATPCTWSFTHEIWGWYIFLYKLGVDLTPQRRKEIGIYTHSYGVCAPFNHIKKTRNQCAVQAARMLEGPASNIFDLLRERQAMRCLASAIRYDKSRDFWVKLDRKMQGRWR